MSYNGTCLCGDVKFSFEYDPMMHFQCHCTICQKVFGTTLNGLVIPEDELTCEGEISKYTITGGSGNDWLQGNVGIDSMVGGAGVGAAGVLFILLPPPNSDPIHIIILLINFLLVI